MPTNTYTAQPEVVEAVQYAAPRGDDTQGNVAEIKAFYIDGEVLEQPGFDPHGSGTCLQLHHGDGPHDTADGGWGLLADGDWLVKHVSGPGPWPNLESGHVRKISNQAFTEAFPSAAPAPAAPDLIKPSSRAKADDTPPTT